MDFLEGSRGIYRPIRVLFKTTIYDRALQLCWHIQSYKSQIALVMELLRIQQKKQIPPQVTAEDMINFLLEQSKSTLRELLWEFELEDFDEDEAKPLLRLVWAVNVCNKMRDVEFEARLRLNSSEAIPPNFQHPKVLSMAQDYAKILREKQQEAPGSKLLCPQEVVLEVVSRVLQGFWVLPPRPLLNMLSQQLSKMSVGVTKAVMDGVSTTLTTGCQTTFSRSTRDDMVLSILTSIRQTWPHDVLVNRINCFAPVLLSEIVGVAVEKICGMFQPRSPGVLDRLPPTVEPPATTPVQDELNLAVSEEQPTCSSETNSAVLSPPPASLTPPAEPASISKVQAREAINKKCSLEKDPEPIREPDSTAIPALPAQLTTPADPVVKTAEQDGLTNNLAEAEQLTSSPETKSTVVSSQPAPLTPSNEPAPIKIQAREGFNEKPCLEKDAEPTRKPVSAAVLVPQTPPAEPPSIRVQARKDLNEKVRMTKERRSLVVCHWLFQPLCSCLMTRYTETF